MVLGASLCADLDYNTIRFRNHYSNVNLITLFFLSNTLLLMSVFESAENTRNEKLRIPAVKFGPDLLC